ncbi:MAG: Diphthamide biosynthesis, partial [Trebouxia sp. A1-2]
MSYDDVEIEDMEWNEELSAFTYPCPCGDLFQITKEELAEGEEIARCPSCSLYITVVYDPARPPFAQPIVSNTIGHMKLQPTHLQMMTALAIPKLQLQTLQHQQHRYQYQQLGRADSRLQAMCNIQSDWHGMIVRIKAAAWSTLCGAQSFCSLLDAFTLSPNELVDNPANVKCNHCYI